MSPETVSGPGPVMGASRPLRLRPAHAGVDPLRIAVLAPPWIPVPPPTYGGIETVVDLLCEALVTRGHEVTLFAAPGSRSTARMRTPLQAAHPDEIGCSLSESDHVAYAWDEIDLAALRGEPFDVVHDHSGFTAVAMADRVAVPVVHTLHGAFVKETVPFYRRHGHKARLVAISRSQAASAPAGVRVADVVPNPIVVDRWPLRSEKQDYLLWVGRMDPVKGAHRAIEAARLAGRTLVLAGPVQPGQAGQEEYFRELVEPHVDGRRVHYVGDVGGTAKQELFANALALLMPIRWREPFGMVMVEALACGTPVIAFPEGAAAEIVIDGENGMLVADEAEMARAVQRLGSIDPGDCRGSVAERYDVSVTAAGYERAYRQAMPIADGQAMPIADATRWTRPPKCPDASRSSRHQSVQADEQRRDVCVQRLRPAARAGAQRALGPGTRRPGRHQRLGAAVARARERASPHRRARRAGRHPTVSNPVQPAGGRRPNARRRTAMTERHVIPDERTTWRVYEAGATAPLSEHTSATAAELAALARAHDRDAERVVVHDRYHRTHDAAPSQAELRARAQGARARQLAFVRERARQLAHNPHTP